MSDPRMTDPRYYQRPDIDRPTGDVNAVWGWVAAAAFVAVVLLFVFASGSDNKNASNNGVNLPPAASAPTLPKNPPSTTGSAPTNSGPSAPGAAAPGGANK
jgi:hypothetical protein